MGEDFDDLYQGLVANRLIVPAAVPGVFGRGAVFEDIIARVDALALEVSKDDAAEFFVFPPVIERRIVERVDYMDSFPHLCGAVYGFFGKELQAKTLSERIHGGQPWGDLMGMTDVVLNPAACYPIYPSLAGVLPPGGRSITMFQWVYRHEPSAEPTRMQSFRVREFVRAGTPDEVMAWRDMWLERDVRFLQSLGLPARQEFAADPFFGRGGKMLAVSQKEQQLKVEIVVPVISDEHPTAVSSVNLHQDHFGTTFDIRTQDGRPAHSACVGLGLERIVMALFKTHGFEPGRWPSEVRARLWP
jgi:seryl-tRNA synthetase